MTTGTYAENEWLAQCPHAKVNGVAYVLDYGEGYTLERLWGNTKVVAPVYVWRAISDLDYTAPPHVADAAYDYLAAVDEMKRVDMIAGWPNP